MNKFEKAILRYETARQLVRDLKEKRSKLISECEDIATIDCPSGFGVIETGITCLVSIFNDLTDDEHLSDCERFDYKLAVESSHVEGNCCDSCYESYRIKTESLAEAKKEFGNSKRQISYMGKSIIGKQ